MWQVPLTNTFLASEFNQTVGSMVHWLEFLFLGQLVPRNLLSLISPYSFYLMYQFHYISHLLMGVGRLCREGRREESFSKRALPVCSTVLLSLNLSTKICFSVSVLHF